MPDTIHLCQAFFSQINPNLSVFLYKYGIDIQTDPCD